MKKLLCHGQIIDFALGLGFAYDATAAEYERPTRCFAPSLILDKKKYVFFNTTKNTMSFVKLLRHILFRASSQSTPFLEYHSAKVY